MLKTEDLHHFVQIAEHQGFSAASKAIGTDVATLSRAIIRLETQLKCSLFRRTTRKVELTPEGDVFLKDVRLTLQGLKSAQEKIGNLKREPYGRLRINAATPFILHVLSPLLKSFLQTYPNIQIELTSDENFVDLLQKKTDVAIRIGALEDSTLKAKLIGRSPMHLVATPDYCEQHGIPAMPEDLLSHRFLGFETHSSLNVLRFDNAPALTPYISASSGETIRRLCLEGNGIAYLSNFMIKDDIDKGRLIPVLTTFTSQANDRELIQAVFYNTTVLPQRIKVFIDFLSEQAVL